MMDAASKNSSQSQLHLPQPQQLSPLKASSSPTDGLWGEKAILDGGGGEGGRGGEGLKLEYMDLDEFLLENAMSLTEGGDSNQGSESGSSNSQSVEPPPHSHSYGTRVSNSRRSLGSDGCSGGGEGSGSISGGSTGSGSTGAQSDDDNENERSNKRGQGIEFNPADPAFQGSSRKNRKTFVPDHCKDERYWQRRRKNNMAAKRSRDARRVKENQIAIRANYLEAENERLKEQLKVLRQENVNLRSQMSGGSHVAPPPTHAVPPSSHVAPPSSHVAPHSSHVAPPSSHVAPSSVATKSVEN